jgi:hypothetical protein
MTGPGIRVEGMSGPVTIMVLASFSFAPGLADYFGQPEDFFQDRLYEKLKANVHLFMCHYMVKLNLIRKITDSYEYEER